MPDLEVYSRKLETMYEVSEGKINSVVQPMVLFSHTKKHEILELANAETDPPKNLQDNGTIRRSAPRHPSCTQPQKTPRLPQSSLHHAPASRPEMPLYKHAWKTSWMSTS